MSQALPTDPAPDPIPDPAPPPSPPAPEPAPDPDPDEGRVFDAAYVKSLREEAAKHRREAREAQARAQAFEDRDKTEAQKLEERAAGAEQRAVAAENELVRTRVAIRKGLTEGQAKRLLGTTEAELEADADELLASFKNDDGQEPPSSRPRTRLRPGAAPSAEPEELDPTKLAAMVPRRFT